ncbi:MAG TPA: toll/interleukin-1 receptor domain-containing protein [Dehalococcoidia bacterium]|nr:toll/interleukin-1 receptor domain-containing protein [Dehalococcoidia bacterium]
MSARPNVFISHSEADFDRAWIRDFAHELEEQGLDVWLDELDIRPGEDVATAVLQALRASDVIVALLSPATASRPNVLFELGAAIGSGKRLVPLVRRLTDIKKLPALVSERQYLVADSPEKAAKAVVEAATLSS